MDNLNIGNIVFKNEKTYCKNHDKEYRDKYFYLQAQIGGVTLTVARSELQPSIWFEAKGLFTKRTFTNNKITVEAACSAALLKTKTVLFETLEILTNAATV